MLVAVIILSIALILLALLVYKKSIAGESESALLLKKDLDRLSEDIINLKDNLNSQIGDRLDKSQSLMVNSLQKQFSESTKLITEVTRSLTELKESNKQVVSITDELKTLQNVLQNPKRPAPLVSPSF